MYIDPDIKVYVRGKLTKIDGIALDEKDFTSVTNNFLHSLFSVFEWYHDYTDHGTL
jgi:hypothetical protein